MSSRVLLLNGPIIKERVDKLEMGGKILRLGVASIAAYLLENNIETAVADPVSQSEAEIKKTLDEFRPDIVGIHAYTSEIIAAAATAGWIRKLRPEITIVVGGPHTSALPEESLAEFSSFDIAAGGEGERTMLELAKGKRLDEISGISYRKEGNILVNPPRELLPDINSLPYPAWHLYNLKAYQGFDLAGGFGRKTKKLELPVEGARGCPFSCIFCFRTLGRNIRFKSARKIADEVERNVRDFGAQKIHFIEGTFAVNKKIALEMCQELINRKLSQEITWSTGGRADILDKELLTNMKEAGCRYIGIGVESGDQQILDIIGKNTTVEQIKKVFALCREVGITTEAEFIIGHPFETEETIRKTIRLAGELPADYATFAILVPFPGTKVEEMTRSHHGGLKTLTRDWAQYGKQVGRTLELEQLPRERLIQYQALAYRKFYLRPQKILSLLKRLNYNRLLYGIRELTRTASNPKHESANGGRNTKHLPAGRQELQ